MQKIADDGCRHIVRQVCHEQKTRFLTNPFHGAANLFHQIIAKRILVPQRIAMNQPDVGPPLQLLAGQLVQVRVNFDTQDSSSTIRQTTGQGTNPRADFENDVSFGQIRRIRNQVDQVQINEKVLSIPRNRAKPSCGQTFGKIRGGLARLVQAECRWEVMGDV